MNSHYLGLQFYIKLPYRVMQYSNLIRRKCSLFVILVISHFGFEGGICLLITLVPVHCFLITFDNIQRSVGLWQHLVTRFSFVMLKSLKVFRSYF